MSVGLTLDGERVWLVDTKLTAEDISTGIYEGARVRLIQGHASTVDVHIGGKSIGYILNSDLRRLSLEWQRELDPFDSVSQLRRIVPVRS